MAFRVADLILQARKRQSQHVKSVGCLIWAISSSKGDTPLSLLSRLKTGERVHYESNSLLGITNGKQSGTVPAIKMVGLPALEQEPLSVSTYRARNNVKALPVYCLTGSMWVSTADDTWDKQRE